MIIQDLKLKTADDQILHFKNPLEYWCQKDIRNKYPTLYYSAIQVVAVPGSRAAVETLFSLYACILTEKRLKMRTDKVEQLVKLKRQRLGII